MNAEPQVESPPSAAAPSAGSLIMLAYDHTIGPVGKDPARTFPKPDVSSLLQEVVHMAGTRLLVASGKDANDTAKPVVHA